MAIGMSLPMGVKPSWVDLFLGFFMPNDNDSLKFDR